MLQLLKTQSSKLAVFLPLHYILRDFPNKGAELRPLGICFKPVCQTESVNCQPHSETMEEEKALSGQLAEADLHVKDRQETLITGVIQCKKSERKKRKSAKTL